MLFVVINHLRLMNRKLYDGNWHSPSHLCIFKFFIGNYNNNNNNNNNNNDTYLYRISLFSTCKVLLSIRVLFKETFDNVKF